MFIEINDIITGTTVTEPLNVYSINYIYGRQDDNVYHLIYVLNNGIRKMEEFTTQQALEDRIAEIKDVNGVGASVYIYRGSCTFQQLPTSDNEVGDVWNITNDFTLDGKDYPAGTNVAWDGTGWDALAGSFTVPVIPNSDIDNLFLANLEFGYGDRGEIIIVTNNISFPSIYWTLDTNYNRYVCSNTNLTGSLSYDAISADLSYNNLFVTNTTPHIIDFGTTPEILAVIQAAGGTLQGINCVFDIPANLFTVNGVGTRARHIEFVYGDPIDGHPYPSN